MNRRIPALAAASLIVLAGCASGESTASPQAYLPGTWTGSATYAAPDGSTGGGPEKLVIEKQDGAMLWGYTEYTDTDGKPTKNVVTGTIADDGSGVVLTEPAATWRGEVDGNELTVVVSWTDSPKDHGAFEMTLTKQ